MYIVSWHLPCQDIHVVLISLYTLTCHRNRWLQDCLDCFYQSHGSSSLLLVNNQFVADKKQTSALLFIHTQALSFHFPLSVIKRQWRLMWFIIVSCPPTVTVDSAVCSPIIGLQEQLCNVVLCHPTLTLFRQFFKAKILTVAAELKAWAHTLSGVGAQAWPWVFSNQLGISGLPEIWIMPVKLQKCFVDYKFTPDFPSA